MQNSTVFGIGYHCGGYAILDTSAGIARLNLSQNFRNSTALFLKLVQSDQRRAADHIQGGFKYISHHVVNL